MVVAKINREYALRMSGVALFMLVICLWSLYDGFLAWPEKNQELDRVRPALLASNLTAKVWLAKSSADGLTPLDLCFAEQSLKTPSKLIKKIDEAKMPSSPSDDLIVQYRERERESLKKIFEGDVYDKHALHGQFVMAGVTALVALAVIFSFAGKLTKRFFADDSGVSSNSFGSGIINYDDIESIDWKQWDKKGIIKLFIKGGAVYTLDGWHFKGITEIVDEIVKHRPELKG